MKTERQHALIEGLVEAFKEEFRFKAQIALLKQEEARIQERQATLADDLMETGYKLVDAIRDVLLALGIKATLAERKKIAGRLSTRKSRITARNQNQQGKPHNRLERGKARVTIDCANDRRKEQQMERILRKRVTTTTEEQWLEDVELDSDLDGVDEVADQAAGDDAPAVHGAPEQRWPERHK